MSFTMSLHQAAEESGLDEPAMARRSWRHHAVGSSGGRSRTRGRYSTSWMRPSKADAADRAHETRAALLQLPDRFDRVNAHERGVGPRERLLERGGEHHLRRSRESVDGRLLVGGELVRSRWGLSGSEARHQAVRVRSHHVRDLGLFIQPGEVLRPLETPEAGPALRRRVAVEGGDEVDEEFWHGRVLVLLSGSRSCLGYHGGTRLDGRRVENSSPARDRVGDGDVADAYRTTRHKARVEARRSRYLAPAER